MSVAPTILYSVGLMLSVGLTGNIASGKSLVAAQLEKLGAVILDADQMGHRLIGPGGAAVQAVLTAFGPGVAGKDQGIDRSRLGPIVFADPAARARLDGIVHPMLMTAIRLQLAGLEAGEAGEQKGAAPSVPLIVAVDAALIFELGMADEFDRVVVVTTSDAQREARLVGRGLSLSEARKRMASQWPEAEKVRRADLVIANDGTPEALSDRVASLWNTLTQAATLPSQRKEHPG